MALSNANSAWAQSTNGGSTVLTMGCVRLHKEPEKGVTLKSKSDLLAQVLLKRVGNHYCLATKTVQ